MFIGYFLLLLILGIPFIIFLKKNNWSLFLIFGAYCTMQYVIVPLFFLTSDNPDAILPKGLQMGSIYPVVDWFTFSVTLIFFTIFILSYHIFSNNSVHQTYTQSSELISYALPLAIILLVVSVFSLFFYIKAFGSFTEMVTASQMVRSGHVEKLDLNNSLMTKRLIGLSFSSLALSTFIEFALVKKIIFTLSAVVILTYAIFISASKQSIIELFFVAYIYFCLKNQKTYLQLGAVLAVIFVIALLVLDPFIQYVATGEFNYDDQSLFGVLQMFSFSQTSLGIAIHAEYSPLYFSDFITNLNSTIFPSGTIPSLNDAYSSFVDFSTQRLNTHFFWGTYDAVVPPSIIAFGYYNAGLLGVALVAMLLGWALAFFDRHFSMLIHYDIRAALPYAVFCLQAIEIARVAIPKYTVYFAPNLVLIMIFLTIFITSVKVKAK